MKIGIIAEDDSDVAVLREISLKLLLPHTNVGFKKCVGRGGGAIRMKSVALTQSALSIEGALTSSQCTI